MQLYSEIDSKVLIETFQKIKEIYPGFVEGFLHPSFEGNQIYAQIRKNLNELNVLLEKNHSEEDIQTKVQNLIQSQTDHSFLLTPFTKLFQLIPSEKMETFHSDPALLFQKLSLWLGHFFRSVFEGVEEKKYEKGLNTLKKNIVFSHTQIFYDLAKTAKETSENENNIDLIEKIVEKLEALSQDTYHPLKMDNWGTYSKTGAYEAVIIIGRRMLLESIIYPDSLGNFPELKDRIIALLKRDIVNDNVSEVIKALEANATELPVYIGNIDKKYNDLIKGVKSVRDSEERKKKAQLEVHERRENAKNNGEESTEDHLRRIREQLEKEGATLVEIQEEITGLKNDFDEQKQSSIEFQEMLNQQNEVLTKLEENSERQGEELSKLTNNFSQLTEVFSQLEEQSNKQNEVLSQLKVQSNKQNEELKSLENRFDSIEEGFDQIRNQQKEIRDRLNNLEEAQNEDPVQPTMGFFGRARRSGG